MREYRFAVDFLIEGDFNSGTVKSTGCFVKADSSEEAEQKVDNMILNGTMLGMPKEFIDYDMWEDTSSEVEME